MNIELLAHEIAWYVYPDEQAVRIITPRIEQWLNDDVANTVGTLPDIAAAWKAYINQCAQSLIYNVSGEF